LFFERGGTILGLTFGSHSISDLFLWKLTGTFTISLDVRCGEGNDMDSATLLVEAISWSCSWDLGILLDWKNEVLFSMFMKYIEYITYLFGFNSTLVNLIGYPPIRGGFGRYK
jgi:hypothetical protein